MPQHNDPKADRKRHIAFINTYRLTPGETADANGYPTPQTRIDRARELTEAAWTRDEAARIQEERDEVARRSQHVPNDPSGATRSGIHPIRY